MKNCNYIKRLFCYIDCTPLNPILLIIVFAVIGWLAAYLFRYSDKSIDFFLTCVGFGLSAAVVQCALIQNRIQKDNIKIQLFDKRYAVFQAVMDSVIIIRRNNWDRYLLFGENDICKQMMQIEENLYRSVQLSICLFDQELYNKLCAVNDAFCKVAKSFKNTLIANEKQFTSQAELQAFLVQFNSQILSDNGFMSNDYEEKLKKTFPKIYINLMELSKECNAYVSFVEECGIKKEFGKYIVVNKLDR